MKLVTRSPELVEEIEELIDGLKELDVFDSLVDGAKELVLGPQQRANPHPPGVEANATFGIGWYGGYVAFLVLEIALPASELVKLLDSATGFSQTITRAIDRLDTIAPALRSGSPGLSQRAAARLASSDGGIEYDADTFSGLSTGQQLTARERLAGHTAKVDELQGSHSELAGAVARPGGQRLLAEHDVTTIQRVLALDRADRHRVVRLLNEKDDRRTIDEELTARDLAVVAERGEINTATIIVKRDDGVVWADKESMAHIRNRHITDENPAAGTTYWPLGQSVEWNGMTHRIPAEVANEKGINEIIYTGLKRENRDPSDEASIPYNPKQYGMDYGISEVNIVTRTEGIKEGQVITAYPTKGDKVVELDSKENVI